MVYPLRPYVLTEDYADHPPADEWLMLLKIDSIHRYLSEFGHPPPADATIQFEHDVTPLEIDITSWHPVVVREERFDPQPDPWIRFV